MVLLAGQRLDLQIAQLALLARCVVEHEQGLQQRVDGGYAWQLEALHDLFERRVLPGERLQADLAHLERQPAARAVFNFAPVLLEQLEDYTLRFDRHAQSGTPFDDFMLDALATLPACGPARARVVRMALRADSARQVEHVPAYRALAERLRAGDDAQAGAGQIGDGDLTDLLIGWHLAWTAPSVMAADAEAAALRRATERATRNT